MKIQSDYIEYVPATPEDVFAVLRNWQSLWSRKTEFADRLDGLTLCADLTEATRLENWPPFADLDYDLDEFGKAMNVFFEISRDLEEWRITLSPAEKCSLGDVCRFVAETALLPRLKPAHVAGVECRPAGAFLAVRDLLCHDDRIMPSTRLSEYAIEHLKSFENALIELVKFSPVPLSYRATYSKIAAVLWSLGIFGLLSSIAMLVNPDNDPTTSVTVGISLCLLLGGCIAAFLPPRKVEVGDLVTFRDLAVCLAGPTS